MAATQPKIDAKERMAQIVATSGANQENLLDGIIQLKQDQFLANLTALRPVLTQISNGLGKKVTFVPVKENSTCLTGGQPVSFGQVNNYFPSKISLTPAFSPIWSNPNWFFFAP